MYDLIAQLIDHSYESGDSGQQYIYFICGALFIVLTAVTLDMIYRVFSQFWRAGK